MNMEKIKHVYANPSVEIIDVENDILALSTSEDRGDSGEPNMAGKNDRAENWGSLWNGK